MNHELAISIVWAAFCAISLIIMVICSAEEKANAVAAANFDWANALDEASAEDVDYCVCEPDDVEDAIQLVRAAEYRDGFEDGLSFAKSRLAGALDDIAPEFAGAICDQCIEDASVGDPDDEDDDFDDEAAAVEICCKEFGDSADQGHDNDDSLDLALEEAGQRK